MSNQETSILSEYEKKLISDLLPPGAKVYVLEKHTTRSGDSVYLQALIVEDGEIKDISWLVGKLLAGNGKWKYAPGRKSVKINAAEHGGTDFGFELVDDLSTVLHADRDHCLQHIWI